MKKLLLICSLGLFAGINAYSQTKESAPLTKADAFIRSGILIQKEIIEVGKVSSVEVKVLVLKDLNGSARISALRLESTSAGSGFKIGSVDTDELDGMIKSLKLMQDNILKTSPDSYTEVSFTSRGGLEAGCYFDEEKSKWAPFIKFPSYDFKSMVFIKPEQMAELVNLLESAKSKMVSSNVFSFSHDI